MALVHHAVSPDLVAAVDLVVADGGGGFDGGGFGGGGFDGSCWWHGTGGMALVAWHWCTTMVLVACAAPSCLWHGATQLKVVWGHPTPPAATGIGATQLPQLPCHL